MNRDRFDELLDDWALGHLSPGESREFESMLLANPNWRQEAEVHRHFVGLVRQAPSPMAPPRLLDQALHRARQPDRRPGAIPRAIAPKQISLRQRIKRLYGTAAAIVLLIVGIAFIYEMTTTPVQRDNSALLVHDPEGHTPEASVQTPNEEAAPTPAPTPKDEPGRIPQHEYRFLAAKVLATGGNVWGGERAATDRVGFYAEFPDTKTFNTFVQSAQGQPVQITIPNQQLNEYFTNLSENVFSFDDFTSQVMHDTATPRVRLILRPLANTNR